MINKEIPSPQIKPSYKIEPIRECQIMYESADVRILLADFFFLFFFHFFVFVFIFSFFYALVSGLVKCIAKSEVSIRLSMTY